MERRFAFCYENWIEGQKSDLADLLCAGTVQGATEMQLRVAIEQCMQHYKNYLEQRKTLVRQDGPAFLCPPWCTSFENSVLWIGGCRPSLMIRLLYSLTGSEMEKHLEEFLQGHRSPGNVGWMNLSAQQLHLVNELHQRTIRAEDRLASKQASLQEDIADKPLLPIIRGRQRTSTTAASTSATAASSSSTSHNGGDGSGHFDAGQNNEELTAAMKSYGDGMAKLVEEADALRLATAKALVMEILSPKQGIELLIAGKQLHLSVHDWGLQRDRQNGRDRG